MIGPYELDILLFLELQAEVEASSVDLGGIWLASAVLLFRRRESSFMLIAFVCEYNSRAFSKF